jgi:hypothetical protein
MEFSNEDSQSYKILYQVSAREDVAQKIIEEKLKKFLAAENFQNLQFL